ncbi:MAG: DNA cytosine methyltransferase [Veillonellaceae bacterium]|nr:DNA cytosine methyltransferase [Veillonellaceae bacterium]
MDMAVSSVLPATTAWVSEIEEAPSRILAAHYPHAPNLGDVTKIDWSAVEPVDIITGGSPCQDLSQAGKRAGMKDGTRSGLWSSMCDAIETIRPSLVVWENVRGALSAEATAGDVESCDFCVGDAGDVHLRALGRVLGDLAELGYDAAWTGLRAADVGAPHGRWRVFVLAWPADDTDRGRRESDASFSSSAERVRRDDASGASADPALTLLPTPRAQARDVAYAREDYHYNLEEWAGHFEAGTLEATTSRDLMLPSAVVQLLPTPKAGDADFGLPRTSGRPPEMSTHLATKIHYTDFGQYAPAIERWEKVLGRPAPPPTEPTGRDGAYRLSSRFVEWMMGLPEGWVTGRGLSRVQELKMLGNGVVPQQGSAAIRHLLGIVRAEVVA